ncbi:YDG/SRA domain-containing protein [Lutimonas saemankumensis]|uniref:YDG/SRA domain-containing protein n=1 Tax=Lutimonas saemankumensis TaxID=483016 RepID=UPI001CD74570|nr:YDG/SRA domain-containing protein [Lutimonas saemankumensis]MCA0931754.1 YDG/SRA domain-containing protein [Lutimonas saemankumensis]
MSNIRFGEIPGIHEGQKFVSRRALVDAGLHRSIQHGIDGNGSEGVAAIVVSGGYEDDLDLGDEIIYTGHGGNDPVTKKQIADQSWSSHGNKGLVVSQMRQLPVRVIRGPHKNSQFAPLSGYKYSGLYRVIDSWDKIGKSGFSVCVFKLRKEDALEKDEATKIKVGTLVLLEPKGLKPKWFSIGVDGPKNAQRLSREGAFAKKLVDRNVGDEIDFGNGFKVLEIKRYLAK